MIRLEDHFRGLSDPTRLRIVNLLLHDELCGCHLQRLLGITQSVVSRHLIYLKRSGLVADRRDGFRVFYRLADKKPLRQLLDFLRQSFRGEEVFVHDLARLRHVLAEGALPSWLARSRAQGNAWRVRRREHVPGLDERRGQRAAR